MIGTNGWNTDYRIGNFLNLSKICESIIHKRLLDHCNENNVISNKQAAYLKGDLTIHQLIYIVDKIKRSWR